MVHQHFLLVPAFTVEENLILAGQQHGFLIDQRSIKAKADQICTKLAWNIPYTSRVSDLTVGVQQRVEILKALLGDARIVLFDEPTALRMRSTTYWLSCALCVTKAVRWFLSPIS